MQLPTKKNHHYVWAHYLRRWSCDGKRVWFPSPKGKIICDSVQGVAREQHFYRANPISERQLNLLERVFSVHGDHVREIHRRHLEAWREIQAMEGELVDQGQCGRDAAKILEVHRNNFIENLHSGHELRARPVLDALAAHDFSVLNSQKSLIDLMSFLGHQITRTKLFRDSCLDALRNTFTKDLADDFSSAWWFVSYMYGVNLGWHFFAHRNLERHCVLVTDAEHPFITSDQPIQNVLSEIGTAPPEKADFVYPICATVAYAICDTDQFAAGVHPVSPDTVKHLNMIQAQRAQSYIFGNSESIVRTFWKHRTRTATATATATA